MKLYKNILALTVMAAAIVSCNNNAAKTEEPASTTTGMGDSAKTVTPAAPVKNAGDSAKDKATTITAQFVEFTLGDASHYIFKDSTGKTWDFADNKDSHAAFAIEVPAKKANEKNQGFSSNKALQGKWFLIRYSYSMQPQYQDGPMANVPIIMEATAK